MSEVVEQKIEQIIAIDEAQPSFYDKDRLIDLLKGMLENLQEPKTE